MDSDDIGDSYRLQAKNIFNKLVAEVTTDFTISKIMGICSGAAIIAFAVQNIHQQVSITDGGTLGMVLLLTHWLGLPTYIVAPLLDVVLYAIAIRFLGVKFLKLSIVSTISLAIFLRIFDGLPLLLPDLSGQPLFAAILGGVIVGFGAGLIVRQGGSSGGDDALVLTICRKTGWRIFVIYLIIDATVLLLSLTYIAPSRIIFSLVTAVTSSLILDLTKSIKLPKKSTIKKPVMQKTMLQSRKMPKSVFANYNTSVKATSS